MWQVKEALLLVLLQIAAAQECLRGAGGTILLADLRSGSSRLPSGSQAIVTSYKIQCCGNITEWLTHVFPNDETFEVGVYTIHFQVWRPSAGGGGDGCYSLVGENRFPELTFVDRGPVSVIPDPTDMISVMPGDVLGYFVSSTTAVPNRQGAAGIQMKMNLTNDVVFYANLGGNPLPMGPERCPMSVGPGGLLNMSVIAAPIIQVEIESTQCPLSFNPSSVLGLEQNISVTASVITIVVILAAALITAAVIVGVVGKRCPEAFSIHRGSYNVGEKNSQVATAPTEFAHISAVTPSPGVELAEHNEYTTAVNIPAQPNQSYATAAPISSIEHSSTGYASVIKKNKQEGKTEESLVYNQGYGTTTPQPDPDQVYEPVEGGHQIKHTFRVQKSYPDEGSGNYGIP